ncbi:MAG: peptidoglycan DD-metalloendopeptidase family protein [Patescibacteria group bacterium]
MFTPRKADAVLRILITVVALVLSAGTAQAAKVLWFPFDYPISVTCGFGCYTVPIHHDGVDYSCPEGTSLYAAIGGTVKKVVNSVSGQVCSSPNFGNYVLIENTQYGVQVIEAHMLAGSITVVEGQVITAGQYIGKSSNSGYTMTLVNGVYKCGYGGGHHLHLETRVLINGRWVAVDPYIYNGGLWTSPLQYGNDSNCTLASSSEAKSQITACRNRNTWLGSATSGFHQWKPSGGNGKWVYIIDYQKGSVVFDALGGAEKAYAVSSYMLGCWAADHGCAGSRLGCPITERYAWNGGLRMDWNYGYTFEKAGISCGPIKWGTAGYYGPGTFAGYAIDCQATYKFAACYARHGVGKLGYPASGNGILPYVHTIGSNPNILAQDFKGDQWDNVVLLYDREAPQYASIVASFCPSPNTPDQASELHGGFRGYWEANGRFSTIGVPFTDEVPVFGKPWIVYQRFIRRSGSNWVACELRYYPNGSVSKATLFTKAVTVSSVDVEIDIVDDTQESPAPRPVLLLSPNPTAGSSTIQFSLPTEGQVALQVFDIAGRLVATLLDETRPSGEYQISWDGKDGQGNAAASGIYFVRLATPSFQTTKRLVVLR